MSFMHRTSPPDGAAWAAHIREHGYLLVPALLDAATLAAGRTAFAEASFADRSLADLRGQGPFEDWAALPPVRACLQDLLGPHRLSALRGRSPQKDHGQQGLHIDDAMAAPQGRYSLINVFFLLDDVDADNGGTRIVPGTHRLHRAPPKDMAQPHSRHKHEIVPSAPAGSLLLFSSHTWHSGTTNHSGRARRIVISQFVHDPRPHKEKEE